MLNEIDREMIGHARDRLPVYVERTARISAGWYTLRAWKPHRADRRRRRRQARVESAGRVVTVPLDAVLIPTVVADRLTAKHNNRKKDHQ